MERRRCASAVGLENVFSENNEDDIMTVISVERRM